MDLNYLYFRHQVSLYMSVNAACERSRAAHLGLVAGYAGQIAAQARQPQPGLSA